FIIFFLLFSLLPSISTLFPYTTLFRSRLIRYFGLMFLGVAIFMPAGAQSGRLWAANSLRTEARDDHDRDVKIKVHRYYDRDHKRSEEHTSELQSLAYLVCRLLLEKKNK